MTYKRKEVIGDCTLFLGDCLEVMPLIGKVDAVVTDPPYLYLNHKLDRQFYHIEWIKQVYDVTKDDSMFLFFGRGVSMAQWIVEADKIGFNFKEEIVWNKRQSSSPFGQIMRVHELINVFSKGKRPLNKVYTDYIENCFNEEDFNKVSNSLKRLVSEIKKIKTFECMAEFLKGGFTLNHTANHGITAHKCSDKNRGYSTFQLIDKGAVLKSIIACSKEHYQFQHPTQKPIKLMENLIKLTTNEGDTVLDSFMGSASTLVACAKMGRSGIGIELDEDYFNIACKRVEDAYKQPDMFGY